MHENYINCGDAWVIALTRQRRTEAAERRRAATPPTLRYAVRSYEFERRCAEASAGWGDRRKRSNRAWRHNQWHTGNRRCTYCNTLTLLPIKGHVASWDMCTVDHVIPLCDEGPDNPSNWAICCYRCNNRKGSMSETEFRALLAVEIACRVAGTMPSVDTATLRHDAPGS